jgi:EmrB/QacA subfamily drug resistance transporter
MGRREVIVTLGALFLCVFLAALDSSIVANALPRVVADLHGFELYAWVTTAYLLSSTAVTPIGGKLGDRYGRKPVLIGGATFFLATTLLCGFAQSMPQLVVLRGLQGVGGGILTATVFATMGQLLPPADRARISGLITGVFSLAAIVGPVVGGFLTDVFSWRAVFYVNLPIGLIALVVLWRFFPPVRYASRAGSIDFGGVATSVLGIVLLLLGLSWGGREYEWGSPQVSGALLGGVALLGLFLWLEGRARDPVLPLSLFRNSVVAISSTNSLAQSMMQISLALFVPLYAQGVLGTSATASGTIMLPLLLSMLISNLSAGMLIAHVGRYKVFAIVGFALCVCGFVALSRLGVGSPPLWLAGCLVVLGAGTGMIFPTLTLSYQSAVQFHELGVATSLNQFCRSIGSTLGAALFGSLLIARFLPEVQLALTPDVAPLVDISTLRDPQSLLDPAAAQAFSDAALAAIRIGLAGALHWVFGSAAVIALMGLVGSLMWRELPMRHGRPGNKS